MRMDVAGIDLQCGLELRARRRLLAAQEQQIGEIDAAIGVAGMTPHGFREQRARGFAVAGIRAPSCQNRSARRSRRACGAAVPDNRAWRPRSGPVRAAGRRVRRAPTTRPDRAPGAGRALAGGERETPGAAVRISSRALVPVVANQCSLTSILGRSGSKNRSDETLTRETWTPRHSLLDPADWDAFRADAHALLETADHAAAAGQGRPGLDANAGAA